MWIVAIRKEKLRYNALYLLSTCSWPLAVEYSGLHVYILLFFSYWSNLGDMKIIIILNLIELQLPDKLTDV